MKNTVLHDGEFWGDFVTRRYLNILDTLAIYKKIEHTN